jgi:hypothetical protein
VDPSRGPPGNRRYDPFRGSAPGLSRATPFLLETVTTGLYWRVSNHVCKDDPEAWRPWSVAYAEMVEVLAEELIRALAPVLLDGSNAFFTEEDIKAAFATRKETPPNIDAGVDFGMAVAPFEIVNNT